MALKTRIEDYILVHTISRQISVALGLSRYDWDIQYPDVGLLIQERMRAKRHWKEQTRSWYNFAQQVCGGMSFGFLVINDTVQHILQVLMRRWKVRASDIHRKV